MKYKKLFILCKGDSVTGGSELVHQLCHELANLNLESYVSYYPFDNEYNIPNDFIFDLAFKTVVVHKRSKITLNHGKLLYSELKKYIINNNNKFINIIETGTARGYSAICMAKALNDCN